MVAEYLILQDHERYCKPAEHKSKYVLNHPFNLRSEALRKKYILKNDQTEESIYM